MIIYLHGLNGSSRAHKARLIRERLAPVPVHAPDYPAHQPARAVEHLSAFFSEHQNTPIIVVGSSMGGFYGQYLARRFEFEHLFLINPALQPWNLLPDFLGETATTDNGDVYEITESLIDQMRRYEVADPCKGVETSIFVDRNDRLIDYRIAETLYRDCGRVMVFEGGNHAFQHMDSFIVALREAVRSIYFRQSP